MSDKYEMEKGEGLQTKAQLIQNMLGKPFQVVQLHPLSCLALLVIVIAAAIPKGRPVQHQPELNVTRLFSAPQSPQPRRDLSLLSALPAKLLSAFSRRAAVPPPPPTPTGPPNAPVLFAPSNGTSGATVSPTLDVSVSDPAGSNLSVTFYGKAASTVGPDFTLVALPDTQYYSSSLNGGTPAMFNAQTQWIVNNQKSVNVAYVAHLGDIVQNGDNGGNTTEWNVADGALKILENAGIPYGVHPGNHDEGATGSDSGDSAYTVLYNNFFGVSRFSGRSYYGGHYGTTNDNHYDLFSAGGMNFIVIYFAYNYNAAGNAIGPGFADVLAWANGVLQQYSDRHAILVSHYIMGNGNPANLSIQGGAIVNTLGGSPNVFLTLAGHFNTVPGEGQRTSIVSGNTVQGLMSDFQDQPHGGNGWLRIMTFSPANNQIRVQTYSPVLNQFMTDVASQFTVPWNMPNSGYTSLGTVTNVASGGHATMSWNNLAAGVQYQWYAVISNGTYTTTGPTWTFTTTGSATPAASLSKTSLAFGNQLVNSNSLAQNVSLTNTGNAPLNFSSITASKDYSQTNTCGASLAAGGSCAIAVTFRPTVATTDNGTITIGDNAAGGSQTITLTGSGVAAAPVANLSATSLTFGSQAVGTTSASQKVTLANLGNAPLAITSVVASGDYAATTCPSSLAVNASCSINVTFTPTATGTRNGAITITDNAAGSPQIVTLTGTGTGTTAPVATLSSTSLSFGTQNVGTTSFTKRVTLINTGTATLNLTSIVAKGDFSQTNTCGASLSAASQCRIRVSFTPTAKGTCTGSIAITDNAGGSPQTISLAGTGI